MHTNLNKTKLAGPALIAVAALLWAIDGVIRRSLFALPSVTIVFLEHLIGTIILVPLTWNTLVKHRLNRSELLAAVAVALLSGLLGTLFFTTALLKTNFIPFSVVFLLQKLQPIFAILLAWIWLKERPHPHFFGWATVAVIAAYFVTFPNGQVTLQAGSGTLAAALYALAAAVAWGSSTVISKYFLSTQPPQIATAWRFGLTTMMALIAVVLLGQVSSLNQVSVDQGLKLLLIALSTGMVALYIYYRGLKHTPAHVSTIIELLFPLVAVLIDIFVYQTWLVTSQYLAAGVLLLSMGQVARICYNDGPR